nr:MAG TPA: hypothetical protein [Caudoviricetes sp.]
MRSVNSLKRFFQFCKCFENIFFSPLLFNQRTHSRARDAFVTY